MSVNKTNEVIYKLTDHMLDEILEKTAEAVLWLEAEFEPFLSPLMLPEGIHAEVINCIVKHLKERYESNRSHICYTFDKDGNLAGFIFITHMTEKRVFVDFIYTFKPYRRQGVMHVLISGLAKKFEIVLASAELSGYLSQRDDFQLSGYSAGLTPVYKNYEISDPKVKIVRLPETVVNEMMGVIARG